jgi:hypothetical protein
VKPQQAPSSINSSGKRRKAGAFTHIESHWFDLSFNHLQTSQCPPKSVPPTMIPALLSRS